MISTEDSSHSTSNFDAIIIGSGHNGLGLACYLSKTGLNVLVCEAESKVGGYLKTEEVIPGYKHSLHAINIGTFPPFYNDFDLIKYGTRLVKQDVELGLIMDKRGLVIHNELPKVNFKNFSKFSEKDAKTLETIHTKFHATWLKEYYSPPITQEERGVGLEKEDRIEWIRMCSMSPRELIDELFESEMVRLFSALRVMEENIEGYILVSNRTKDEYQGTADYLFKVLTDPRYVVPEGGSVELALGLSRIVAAYGGSILTDAPVDSIIIRNGRAVGVRLTDGRMFNARKLVACNVDIFMALKLIGEDNLDSKLVRGIHSVKLPDYGKFDLHIASLEPPKYSDIDDQEINRSLNVFVGYDGMDDIDIHADEMLKGKFPEKPSFHGGCPTLYDPTLAPPGKHTLWEWNFMSSKHAMNITETEAEDYKGRILSRWQEFAPNLTDEIILDSYPYYPRMWGSQGGTPSLSNGQYYNGRPTPELSGYRTPIISLYLCHSSCHPGATVRFGPCYNALTVIANDLGIKKWWSDPVPGSPFAKE